jgi:hypothetical protein
MTKTPPTTAPTTIAKVAECGVGVGVGGLPESLSAGGAVGDGERAFAVAIGV